MLWFSSKRIFFPSKFIFSRTNSIEIVPIFTTKFKTPFSSIFPLTFGPFAFIRTSKIPENEETNAIKNRRHIYREFGKKAKEDLSKELTQHFPRMKVSNEQKIKFDPKKPHDVLAQAFESLQKLSKPKSHSPFDKPEIPQMKSFDLIVDLLSSPVLGPTVIKRDQIGLDPSPSLEKFFSNPFDDLELNALVKSFANKKDSESGQKAINIAKEKGFRISANVYASLISAHTNPDNAFEVLKQMAIDNVAPDLSIFNALANCCVKAGQLDRAFNVLDLIQQHQLIPDKICYTTLINGCVILKNYEKAWQLFDACRTNSLLKPDEVTYSILIHTCAKEGLVERAINLFREMEIFNLRPTEITYNSIIYACSKRRDYYHAAFDYFERMKQAGFVPNKLSLQMVLYASAINGDVKISEMFFFKFKEKYPLDLRVLSMMIQTYANALKHSTKTEYITKGEQYWQELLTLVSKPDLYALNIYLTLFTKGLRFKLAQEKFNTIFEQYQYQPDLYSFSSMTKMYFIGHKYDLMLEMYSLMKEKQVEPNEKYFNLLLNGFDFMLPQATDKLVMVLEDMILKHQIQPQRDVVTKLLKKVIDLQAGRNIIALTAWTPRPLYRKYFGKQKKKGTKLKNLKKKFKV